MLAATTSIVKTEGSGALLSGLGPTVVGYGIEGAMKFGVYEVAKPIFANILSNNEKVAFLCASILAGGIAALLLCPMESLRIKQVTDPTYAEESLLTGLPKLIGAEGIASLFAGVAAMLTKQVSIYYARR
jgi:solute carrier family 25 phosphate transporter 3